MSRRGPLSFPVARGERLRGLALEQVLAGRSSEAGTEPAMELRIAPEAGRKRRFEEVAGACVHALEKAREAELVSVLHDGALRRSLEGAREAPGRHRQLLRSEEHTSELQSRENLVCRLLLEKKKMNPNLERTYSIVFNTAALANIS